MIKLRHLPSPSAEDPTVGESVDSTLWDYARRSAIPKQLSLREAANGKAHRSLAFRQNPCRRRGGLKAHGLFLEGLANQKLPASLREFRMEGGTGECYPHPVQWEDLPGQLCNDCQCLVTEGRRR
jgi:hypothetical protein